MSRGRTFMLAATGTLAGLAFAVATGVGAQTVEGLDLAKVRARAAANAADAESLARIVAKRGDALRDEAVATAAASRARLREANVSGPTVKGGVFDFDAMVASAGKAAEPDETPRLIAFASLSMPQASLKAMIADVSRAGGVVVFRGLPGNSAKIFTTAIAKVLPAGEASSVGIDPRLFRAFRVEAVPAYVVTASGLDLCDGFDCTTALPPHDRVSGNVTTRFVLDTIADGDGPGAAVAKVYRARLTKGSE